MNNISAPKKVHHHRIILPLGGKKVGITRTITDRQSKKGAGKVEVDVTHCYK